MANAVEQGPADAGVGVFEPEWVRRFRAVRVSLPQWAEDAPDRCLYSSNAGGVRELHAWDRARGTHRQVTDRPNGTLSGAVEPDGEGIWWFADTDGDEWGVWMRQPFGGGPDVPPAPDLPPSYSAGLALGDGVAVVGRSTDDGASVYLVRAGRPAAVLYSSPRDAWVGGLSRDGRLVCVVHSEHGDSRHPALRVIRADGGGTVADLWDGPAKGLESLGFAPVAGDDRLLVQHERRGRPELVVWDPVAGTERELLVDLPGEIEAEWCPDGRAVLVVHRHAGRSDLHRFDLATGTLQRLDTPAGTVAAATARPDGSVEFDWSSSAAPPSIRAVGGGVVLTPPGAPAPASVPVTDAWVDGPGGRIHALVAAPPAGAPPHPTVFLIHGGPTSADLDAFAPRRAAYVDAGYCVVHVNYRGSTGYGSSWRDALEGRPGLTELEDVAAVLDWTVASGLSDPDRCVLSGGSWGGYLTLLGLGTQPERWAAGVAAVPVADYVAAYEDEMESLREFDRSVFGGSPEELPDLYRRCSPITYVDRVRAPVLILAGANDPRCPIRQIDNYLARLAELGASHEVYRFDAGHGSLVVDEQIRQAGAEVDFCRRQVPPR